MSLDLQRARKNATETRAGRATTPAAHAGLVTGGNILTMKGARPVETLKPGDRIITRDGGVTRLAGLCKHAQTSALVCIHAGAFGDNLPVRDTILAVDQRLLLRDACLPRLFNVSEALVRAGDLVDGQRVTRLCEHRAEHRGEHCGEHCADLFELVFETPHVVYAEGLELAAGHAAPERASVVA